MKTMRMPLESRRVEIAVDICGDGPPVVMLHGIPGSRRTWSPTLRSMRDRMTCIAPDLPGFGDSSSLPPGMHAVGHAGVVGAMLDHLGIASAHIVGFDFGGPIAVSLHRASPERVRSLTLAATNLFPDTPIPPPLGMARIPIAGELLFRTMFSTVGMAGLWLGAVRRKSALSLRDFIRSAPGRSRASTRAIFLQSLRHLLELYLPIELALAAIRVPAAVVWGDRDPFFAIDVGRRTAAAIATSTFNIFVDCGHFIPAECPEDLARVIADTVLRGEERGEERSDSDLPASAQSTR